MISGTTSIFAEGSPEHAAIREARKSVEAKGSTSRKHFLDSYAEHLEALKRAHATK